MSRLAVTLWAAFVFLVPQTAGAQPDEPAEPPGEPAEPPGEPAELAAPAAPAGPANLIVVAGLRPTGDRAYKQFDLKRLREAQGLRELVDEAVREVSKRPILNDGGLRALMGSKYLVSLFKCNASPPCIARVFADLRNRATAVVYGDYTRTPDSNFFRFRLIDLKTGKLLAEVEFAMETKQLPERRRWRRELTVLLATLVEVEDAGTEGAGGEETGEETGDAGGTGEEIADTTGAEGDGGGTDDLDELEAELDDTQGGAGGGDGVLVRRFRANLTTEFRSYPVDRKGPKKDEQFFVESELELDIRMGSKGSFFFRPRFLMDTLDTDLQRFEPYEGYFQISTDDWDLRLGQFIDNWGIADAFNPIDVLNRRDYAVDAIDPTALGELGAHLRYQFPSASWFGEPTISAYVMPLWRETLLPLNEYRYSLSQAPFVLVHDTTYPDPEHSIFTALRFEHTLNTGAFSADLQYIGARGPARFPAITPVPQPDMTIQLLAEYYGTWITGGGFRLVPNSSWLSKFTLKAEVVYTRPYRDDMTPGQLPNDYLQYVGGFDRVFDSLFTDLDALTFTVEYLGEYMDDPDDFMSQFRAFERDVAGRLLWEAKDFARASVELKGVVDVKNGELVGQATIGRQLRFINDDLRLEIFGQLVRPERDMRDEPGFFAFFPNNSNVRARLAFDF